jgi:amino acid adenylation domain-containing protein
MQAVSIQQMLSQVAQDYGDNVAIEYKDRRVRYSELEQKTNLLAERLNRFVPQGSIIALLIEDRVKLIESIIAILKAGCVFMPLAAENPDKRLQLMIEKTRPDLFMIEPEFDERVRNLISLAGLQNQTLLLNQEGSLLDPRDVLDDENPAPRLISTRPSDICYIYFTSGSTGAPKAIAGRQKSLLHFIEWEIKTFGVTPGYRISQFAIPTFDAFLRDVFVPICAGATSCIPASREVILDSQELIRWIDENKINLIHCVPSIFRSLLREQLNGGLFKLLKHIIMAGEQLFGTEIKQWMDVFGERISLANLYGATENTMAKFCHFIREADTRRKTITIGKPIDGATAIILDSERAICDPGVVGEIYIRTPFLTLGYYNDPELTKEVFIQNPFTSDPEDIIYKTGDFGRLLPDGNYELIGRRDHQVKIRGLRVELGEIESALKQHTAVAEVLARVWEDNPDDQRLAAYIVVNHDHALAANDLREFAQQRLPEHMVPSSFVMLEKLPLTRTGKLDRNALPRPEQTRLESTEPFVAPATLIEVALERIWSQILGVEAVGINDSFFSLGGHSLLATQVMSRVRQEFQVDVPLRDLFEKPTIARLAAVIEKIKAERAEAERLQVLEMIKSLSEDEVGAMLEQYSHMGADTNLG